MEEWKEYKLGEICKIFTGKKDVNQTTVDGLYPFFSCAPTPYQSSEYIYDGKAIIVAGNGSFTGRVSYYIGKFDLYQRTYACVPSLEIFDFFFLFYYMKAYFEPKYMGGTRGSSIPYIVKGDLADFKIKLPSIAKQQQLASILKSLDDKIDVNRRINDNLELQAQALFKSWFVDFEPFKDGEFVESELGMIPKGWRVGCLSSIADYMNGLAMQKYRPNEGEVGLPVLKIKELGQGSCDLNSELCSPTQIGEKYIIDNGDIIFSWSGTLMVKVWCGGRCGLNQHLFVVNPNNQPKWFVYLWTKHHLGNFIRIAKDKAVTMGHIKRGELDKAMVLIPPPEVMSKLDSIMKPIYKKMISSELELRRLAELRDTLLPRLMSGEIQID